MEHSHKPEEIRERLAGQSRPSYLADAILGGIDGCVTTMAVIARVAGAGPADLTSALSPSGAVVAACWT
ncbi:MAG: hypothetical protein EA406_11755 [Rhodospirillales bacterium]|nr:MAG: hypothetical protein EA406_11755 [Rhodospirillales bacterium]